MERKSKRFCIILAGMHRSGTSVLSKVLGLLGCDLPKNLFDADSANETGYWEPAALVNLNDQILESAGSSWDDWSPCMPGWMQSPKVPEYKERAQVAFREEFSSSPLAVFKDPRICRLLPFWLETLTEAQIQPLVIIPFRSPLEVAASLAKRDNSDEQYNMLVWLRHVLDAEYESRGVPRYFSAYDDLVTNWPMVASKAEEALGIKWPRKSNRSSEEIDDFISQRHRHHLSSPDLVLENPSISSWIRDTFAILLSWKGTGGNKADFAALDRIRQEFDASAEVFGRLIFRGKVAGSDKLKLEQALSQFKVETAASAVAHEAEKAALQAELANLNADRDSLVAEVGRLHVATNEKSDHIDTLNGRQADLEAQLQAALAELEQEKATSETLRRNEAETAQQIEAMRSQQADLEAQLHTALAELEQEKAASETLRQTEAEATQQIEAMRSRQADLEAQLHTALAELEQEKTASETLRQTEAETAQQIEAMSSQQFELEAKMRGVLEDLEQEKSAVSAAKTEMEAIHEALRVKIAESESESSKFSTNYERMSLELHALSEIIMAAERRESDLQDVIGALSEDKLELASRLESTSNMLEATKQEQIRLQQIEDQLGEARLSLTEIRSLTHSLLADLMPILGHPNTEGLALPEETGEEDVAASSRFTAKLLDFTVRSLNDAALSQRQSKDQLFESLAAVTDERNTLKDNLSAREKVIFELHRHIDLLNEDQDGHLSELKAKDEAIAQKAQVIAALQIHTDELGAVLEKSHNQMELRLAELAQMEQKVHTTESALRQRSAETEDLHREIEEKNHQLVHLTREYETANSALELLRTTFISLSDQAGREALEKEQMRRSYESLRSEGQHTVGQLIQLVRAYSSRRLPLLWRLTANKKAHNIKSAGLIDEAWYTEKYPDVATSGMTPARHYALFGVAEGRSPTPYIDKFR